MDEKRVRVVVHGRVQGVGFRAACQAEAVAAGVRGWVRNKWDGSVEALFEGAPDAVDRLVRWCERGPRMADVERVEQHDAPEPAPPGSFRVR
jgi:acylphosphatase